MDRNSCFSASSSDTTVALRKESVDRNIYLMNGRNSNIVALRKESVDRNAVYAGFAVLFLRSLSARRAWIEIGREYNVPNREQSRSPQGERG